MFFLSYSARLCFADWPGNNSALVVRSGVRPAQSADSASGFLRLRSEREGRSRARSDLSMWQSRNACGKRVPEINSHASQDNDRSVRANLFKRIDGWKRRVDLLIDQHHVHDHGRAGDRDDEMNDAQSDADSQRHGADDCAPHQVTLMHLTEQCEPQQPWRGDRNQRARVMIAQMSPQSARA